MTAIYYTILHGRLNLLKGLKGLLIIESLGRPVCVLVTCIPYFCSYSRGQRISLNTKSALVDICINILSRRHKLPT